MALLSPLKLMNRPGSIVNGPSTPPFTADSESSGRVATILYVLKGCREGNPPSAPWTVYPLNSEEYRDLQCLLREDEELWKYVDECVRYDYDPYRSKLFIRMPTTLHKTLVFQLVKKIQETLANLGSGPVETQPFIDKIDVLGGSIYFGDEGKRFKHEPDLRFHHKDAAWPGIVIEISYLQKRKDLVYLADNYLLESDGGVRVVVGIDLDYRQSKAASISIWRLKMTLDDDGLPEGRVFQEVENELFRDAEGKPVLSSPGLKLPLHDFAVQSLTHELPKLSVIIDPQTLCTMLATAETWHDRASVLQGAKPARIKRKYHQSTPDEQFTTSDGQVIAETRRIQRKSEKDDTSHTPHS